MYNNNIMYIASLSSSLESTCLVMFILMKYMLGNVYVKIIL